jgi:hypothetical protein
MNFQALLANLATNLRRPGFLKSVAGQLAVAYGSQLALEAATEADERWQKASDELEALETRITASRADLRDRILSGEVDAYVIERYEQLAKEHAEELERERLAAEDEEGPPETFGAVVDLPGEEPAPPCARSIDCVLDYEHAGPCRPAVPPRMAGGYLRTVDPGTQDVGILAGDGSDDQPYRKVENLSTVLDDDQAEETDRA